MWAEISKLISKLLEDRIEVLTLIISIVLILIAAFGTIPVSNQQTLSVGPPAQVVLYFLGGIVFIISLLIFVAKQVISLRERIADVDSKIGAKLVINAETVLPDPKLQNWMPSLAAKFRILDIGKGNPKGFYGVVHAPIGFIVVDGIPFYLQPALNENNELAGHVTIVVQPNPDTHTAQVGTLDVAEDDVSKVHFLITAGHGWTESLGVQFLNKRIGYIELVFGDRRTHKQNLILGKNVREWNFGKDSRLVRDIDTKLTHPAWASYDNQYLLDALSIGFGRTTRNLIQIKFVVEFEESISRRINTPAINVSAITCERRIGKS